jgi:hypothetical protein
MLSPAHTRRGGVFDWRRDVRHLFLIILYFAATPSAQAAYPYIGYFTISLTRLSPADVEALCSLKYFVQYDDGRAEDYFLDVNSFRTSKKLVFMRSNTTSCIYNAPDKTEVCTSTYQSADVTESFSIWNYLQRIDPDYLETIYFRTQTEYETFIATSDRSFIQSRYPTTDFIYTYRCPNHSITSLSSYIRTHNDLTSDQTSPLQTPILDGVENLREVGEAVAKLLRPTY